MKMKNFISPEVIFMVSSSSDYACIINANRRYIAVSQPYANIIGYENPQDLINCLHHETKDQIICDTNGKKVKIDFTQRVFRDVSNAIIGTLLFATKSDCLSVSLAKANELDKEREQYREALLHDADYSYHVDLTENIIEKPLIANDPIVDYDKLDYPFPMNYDRYLKKWNTKYKMEHTKPENADEMITCAGLLKAYSENKRHIEFEYNIDVLKSYRRKIVLLSQNTDNHHVVANIIIKDISKEQNRELEYQQQLIESNKKAQSANQAKTDFFSQMSHDMRTPMNAILGFAELGEQEAVRQQSKEYFTHIKESGGYLLGLINDTLDMSKIEQNKIELHPKPHDFKEFETAIENMLVPKATQKGVKFVIRNNNPCGVCVEFDKMRLQQVFVNLIGNAIKFTPSGGTVELKIISGKVTSDKRLPHTFIVRDNGIGMSEEFVKNNLFKPFEQEHSDIIQNETGTGLGVCIAKNIIELMGGSIECKSILGKGTTFTIHLYPKISTATIDINKNGPKVDEAVLMGKQVLLCEDHPMNIQIAVRLLKKKGIEATVAHNGQEGVSLFKESKIGFYNAILMDVRMPVMDGLEATEKIRALERADAKVIPIIALSANAFDEDVQKSKAAGMNSHLTKPIEPSLLYETLFKEVLDYDRSESK